MALMMLYAVINGIPIKQIVRYVTVPFTASAGVDITDTIGCTSISSNAIPTIATPMNKTMVLPTALDACFLLSAPIACAILTVVPIARPTIITVIICMICEPTDTAVVLATPSYCPIINKSAIP